MDQQNFIDAFHEGHSIFAYRVFGAHYHSGKATRFTVYAPHARRVSVVGSFTNWDENPIMMERTGFQGIWRIETSLPKLWDSYKYKIEDGRGNVFDKADPYAFYADTRPLTNSKIVDLDTIQWNDDSWLTKRTKNFDQPMNIYEVYAGGWHKNGEYPYSYAMLENELIPYVKQNGFSHIEFMPLNEYPYDGSWGYQASGYYAVTSRYGNPYEFAHFVNACHRENIGVIIDMVPVHFVKDDFGLRYFDGEPLYEYSDRYNTQSQWGTMNFNLYNEEVRSFLMSAAGFWCDVYHVDGIRIDAVSHLIYWGGNRDRGLNEGSMDFIKRMNYYLNQEYPEVMLIAEDSSDYPGVTKSTLDGGLGFDYKWDLGWMNDTLQYYATDPLFRIHDHHKITFSMAYFFSERFLLPFSHDENVHGKKTIIDRMWGSYEDKFSQVRNLYAYMFAHPGKKLNFMGNEIATFREFDENKELDWFLLDYPMHEKFHIYFQDLNAMYRKHTSLYKNDYAVGNGFTWIDADNAKESIYSFYRESDDEYLICIMNCRQDSYESYDIKVPKCGKYAEILNSQAQKYGGNGMINTNMVSSWKKDDEEQNYITIQIASWAAIYMICPKTKE